MSTYQSWRHVFKLDPNKPIEDHVLEQLCESGTDAIIVGGTDGVTLDNTLYLLSRIRQFALDCALEVSTLEAITPGFDYYFIPSVLNAQDVTWLVGKQHEAMKEYGDIIDWDIVVAEGYCVLNPEAKVAKLTNAKTKLTTEDVAAYAQLADKFLRLPVFYVEYSGHFGDMDTLKQAKRKLNHAQLFYGGGITTAEQATQAANYADTIVVGNVIYEDVKQALETVTAVKKNQ
ncbi:heptaprenylglyceryl phosphate synthase [Terrilactibacillus sp. BCM23-1]|uniref:Heptaprenylglyceryl phosphate synthase n=1 Tax=Terrilactibacillus tamarindi TaxID=2599694 RepID=A0A6N8CS29_9BACI|nr:heptaprenylglyceryl phosphate synthase [Terrilactibacillus tamarindi]MTT33029.1 heptaprenylglyceryl phosphate synthase [Terrilactibacillus tamarindi]